MPKTKVILDEKIICEEYVNTKIGIEAIATKYHVGKLKIKDILKRNGIDFKKRGAQSNNETFIVSDYKVKKYINTDTFTYIVIDPNNDMFSSKDIDNKGGVLTTYIENRYNVKTPSLYDRRMYYMRTGNYWWEQWLQYTKVENKSTKKCPYCDWETIDTENKSGAFEQHLLKTHGITKRKYISDHPEDREYFVLVNPILNRQLMEDNCDNYVVCKICGKKYERITNKHLESHGLTKYEYMMKYGNEFQSKRFLEVLRSKANKMNLAMDGRNDIFQSKAEIEIIKMLKDNGLDCGKNRSILNGKELDIYIPSKNVAIEYNGNKWHSEFFGHKDRHYHIDKLNGCNKKGISLIQIFEDEYELNKELVIDKIKHILHIDNNKESIFARKCSVKVIDKYIAEDFLNRNHIQGFASASLYLGLYYNTILVAVMSFIEEDSQMWNLNRFASNIKYNCVGAGGKLFKYFIKNYQFKEIKSFADRRWTINQNSNLYTKLGFSFVGFTKPDYAYYNSKVDRYKRFHKFGFRKQILSKRYNLPLEMTELEMMKELGYDRIWDCGLIKYVYKKEDAD